MLSIEGRPVSAEEAAVIVEAIQLNSDITISLIEEDNELKNIEMKEKSTDSTMKIFMRMLKLLWVV